MNEFFAVLGAVLPVFCIAGAGALMRHLEWLTEEADQSLLRVTVNLLAPCLILHSVLSNAALEKWRNLVFAPLVGFGTVALGIGLGLLAARFLKLGENRAQRTFAFSVGIYNYGYVPIPLALLLFDRETAGVLFVHNVGVEFAFWSIGLLLLGHESPTKSWRKLINPPMVAIIVAVLINLAGGRELVPGFLLTTIGLLGQTAIPLGLILIGATMSDQFHHFQKGNGVRVMTVACLLRLGVLPVLFLLLAKFLPATAELKRVILLQAAMPSAVFAIIMAKHYSGDPATALRVVISTSAVGLLTIPLWLRIGRAWLGL